MWFFFVIALSVFQLPQNGMASISFLGAQITFSCPASSIPMWMMQGGNDKTIRGIAVGDRKQTTFKNDRFVHSNDADAISKDVCLTRGMGADVSQRHL